MNPRVSNPAIFKGALLGCLLLLAGQWASAQEYFSLSEGYFLDHVRSESLDPRMKHKGQFKDGLIWKDEAGENFLLLCYDADAQLPKRDIYLYQYSVVGGKCNLVWDIQDFSGPLCEMTFVDGSLQLIDLDHDGILEVGFMYQNSCDGLDPTVTKLMLLSKGKKLAIRGKFDVEDKKEVEMVVDPVVALYPPLFKNFMLMNWQEFKTEGEFSFAKSIAYRTEHCLVMKREYQLASGGTSYILLDPNGLPLPLTTAMSDKLMYPTEIELMPDRKTLLYAGLHGVGTYDPTTKKDTPFVTFLESTQATSSVVWSPDKAKFAFTALNPDEYPQRTRIFVISLNGNEMAKKEKFDASLLHMAASEWMVESPGFRDNKTLEYTEMRIVDNEMTEGDVKTIRLE